MIPGRNRKKPRALWQFPRTINIIANYNWITLDPAKKHPSGNSPVPLSSLEALAIFHQSSRVTTVACKVFFIPFTLYTSNFFPLVIIIVIISCASSSRANVCSKFTYKLKLHCFCFNCVFFYCYYYFVPTMTAVYFIVCSFSTVSASSQKH